MTTATLATRLISFNFGVFTLNFLGLFSIILPPSHPPRLSSDFLKRSLWLKVNY